MLPATQELIQLLENQIERTEKKLLYRLKKNRTIHYFSRTNIFEQEKVSFYIPFEQENEAFGLRNAHTLSNN
ncbi:hypothetical protein ACOMCU_27430 [Lysinibacillus sp. UGB7]|uniref:hypothetical protein n=1 Tax=Lysinibacillus sp. UGB7 TaxID=3411039 RepID=UPI003B7A22EF